MQKEANFLTIAQAAEFLNVSPDTLRRWEERGIVTPQRTRGGSRRYTLYDLKIAKLNKRKTRFFGISTLIRQNYINSKRDLRIVFLTSCLWILSLLAYHFIAPDFLKPTNPNLQIISAALKEQKGLKVVSEADPAAISAIKILIITLPAADKTEPTAVSNESDLLISKIGSLPALQYSDSPNQYYSLEPLPQNERTSLIRRN